jgi:hypothetical protein
MCTMLAGQRLVIRAASAAPFVEPYGMRPAR